ncbi:MAG: transaldolase family protein [Nitrospirota bacterium]
MRPNGLRTRIFLDGGDPGETRALLAQLGFLDGQTTNPTLIAKNPDAKERLARGDTFASAEVLGFYRNVVTELSGLMPKGSVSIEVYADSATKADAMLRQGREMYSWIPNAHIKFPTTREGLKAAQAAVAEGLRVNMTLCFSQEQAAAVYGATRGAKKGQVFVSPFIGRLDDRGENGLDLIANILKMYAAGDGHVEVLTASVRSLDQFLAALALGTDIITAPAAVLRSWGERGMPGGIYAPATGLRPIPYRTIDLDRDWTELDIRHDLTDKGMEKFSADWNGLVRQAA